MNRACEHCGESFEGKTKRARFCSVACKDAAHCARLREETLRSREVLTRSCEQCGEPIPATRKRNAITCSRECNVALANGRKSKALREAWDATNPTCARCGGPIPATRRLNVKYCSVACKRASVSERARARASDYMRAYLYGITPAQYDAMLEAQGHACASCFSDEWGGKTGVPHVDHDHATGEVRGLLCSGCNHAIGHAKDDPARLRQMADYLERALARS